MSVTFDAETAANPSLSSKLRVSFDSGLNDLAVVDTSGTKEVLGGRPVVASMRNVKITNNSGTPNSKLDFTYANLGTFFEVILQDSSSPPRTFRGRGTATITLDATATGANGLDTGSLANSTCYFLYYIAKADGTLGVIASTSSGGPSVMPATYIFKALVGALFTNGSGQLQKYLQIDNRAEIVATNVLNNIGPSVAGTLQSLSLSAVVPSIAQAVSGIYGTGLSGNGADIVLASDANGCGKKKLFDPFGNTTISEAYYASAEFTDLLLAAPQTLYWTSPINTNAKNRIDITGWRYGC